MLHEAKPQVLSGSTERKNEAYKKISLADILIREYTNYSISVNYKNQALKTSTFD